MSLFNFGKKKESACDCGGKCEPKVTEQETKGCCGNVDADSVANAKENLDKGASVKVLGSGCKKCNDLEEATIEALKILNMDTTVDHVTDFAAIASYGVMTTPALVVDGKVLSYGKVLKSNEVVELLKKARG